MDQFRLREIAWLAQVLKTVVLASYDSDTDQLCQVHCSLKDAIALSSKVKFLSVIVKTKLKQE